MRSYSCRTPMLAMIAGHKLLTRPSRIAGNGDVCEERSRMLPGTLTDAFGLVTGSASFFCVCILLAPCRLRCSEHSIPLVASPCMGHMTHVPSGLPLSPNDGERERQVVGREDRGRQRQVLGVGGLPMCSWWWQWRVASPGSALV